MEIIRNTRFFIAKSIFINKVHNSALGIDKSAALLAAIGLVSACGGSGGSSSTPEPEPEPEPASAPVPVPAPELLNSVPLANAGADQNVTEQEQVTLNGAGSSDSDGSITSYLWSQTAGAAVDLSDATNLSPTFVAPITFSDEVLTFELTVTDDDDASAVDSVEVNIADIPSPAIVSTLPADLSKEASRSDEITVQFSETILPSSIDSTRFILQGPSGVIPASVRVDGATATLTPDKDLTLLTPYTVVLSREISGELNNSLGVDVSWSFVTEDGRWGGAEFLEAYNEGNVDSSRLAVDDNGNAIVVWRQASEGQDSIWAKYYSHGDVWGEAFLIEEEDLGAAITPQVGFDSVGNSIVVWIYNDGVRRNIWANHFNVVENKWSGAEEVESAEDGDAGNPQIKMDSSGNAVVMWEQSFLGQQDALVRHYRSGTGNDTGTWGDVEIVGAGIVGEYFNDVGFSLAMNSDGDALALISQTNAVSLREAIVTSHYSIKDGVWSDREIIVSDDLHNLNSPKVALDDKGNAIAMWSQGNEGLDDMWSSRYSVDEGWGVAELIVPESETDAGVGQISFDSNGVGVAIWEQEVLEDEVWSSRYTAEGGWGEAVSLSIPEGGRADDVQVAFDSNGNALAVWSQNAGHVRSIWAARYEYNGGWVAPQLIEDIESVDSAKPKIAVDKEGNAFVIWEQWGDEQPGLPTQTNIYVNRFE